MAVKEKNIIRSVDSISACEPDIETETDDGDFYFTEFIISGSKIVKHIGKSKVAVIPDNITSIPGGVWSSSDFAYKSVVFDSNAPLEELIIGTGVKEIAPYTFTDMKNLKRIVIGDNVRNIGSGAFNNCKSLTDVTIPEGAEIDASAFDGCASLTQIRMKKKKK